MATRIGGRCTRRGLTGAGGLEMPSLHFYRHATDARQATIIGGGAPSIPMNLVSRRGAATFYNKVRAVFRYTQSSPGCIGVYRGCRTDLYGARIQLRLFTA